MKNLKNKMRNTKGITLVALVITIIILLILAAITIAQLSGSRLFENAKRATEVSKQANLEEQVKLAVMGSLDNNGDIVVEDLVANLEAIEGATVTGTGFPYTVTVGTASVVVNENGTVGEGSGGAGGGQSGRASITETPTGENGKFATGQEVTFGGEKFFVVSDNGTKLTLLAKYCLNRAGTAQTDKDATFNGIGDAGYGRQFSNSNYWPDRFTSSPYDLQTSSEIGYAETDSTTNSELYVTKNAVLTARAYGQAKGVTGRLMTKGEADSMRSSNIAIMNGKWTEMATNIL